MNIKDAQGVVPTFAEIEVLQRAAPARLVVDEVQRVDGLIDAADHVNKDVELVSQAKNAGDRQQVMSAQKTEDGWGALIRAACS